MFLNHLGHSGGPPRNLSIAQVSSTSLVLAWLPPLSGPPETHYLVTYILLANSSSAVCKEKETLLIEATHTSVVLRNLNMSAGTVHIVVVTAVSGNVSSSSKLQYLSIC